MGRGKGWRTIAWLGVAMTALGPMRAEALPVLRLFLEGERERLGSGGADAFRDRAEEARRLERPSLLAETERPLLLLGFENESILRLDAGSWKGTEAWDRRLHLTALVPLPGWTGLPATAMARVRQADGRIHLATAEEGTLLDSRSSQTAFDLGLSLGLGRGLAVGGLVGTGAVATSWLLEARLRPAAWGEAWIRHGDRRERHGLRVPDDLAHNVRSPALRYRIDEAVRETEIGLRVGDETSWARGALVPGEAPAHWLELGARPLAPLALRLGTDRNLYRFDDTIEAVGDGTIAEARLGLARERYFAGADLDLFGGTASARYVHTDLRVEQRGHEVGTAAARAFLELDYDLGLFFRGDYRLEGHQIALGWRRTPEEGIGWAAGAQLFRMILHPSDFAIRSDALQRALATEEIRPARVDLLGLTGSLTVPAGPVRFVASVGQFVPIGLDPRTSAGGGSPASRPGRPKEAGPYDWLFRSAARIGKTMRDYGGGNRLLLEVQTEL